jgi:protein-disulfide isomerase/uncharacterized membrane protein
MGEAVAPEQATRRKPLPGAVVGLGAASLLVAIAASAVLTADHLEYLSAPGCGDGTGCDRAARSVWGTIPILGWPVAFLGLAWFVAAGAAWAPAALRGGAAPWLRLAARAGAAVSVLYVGVMVAGGYLCPWCLAVHLGGFGFLASVELAPCVGGPARGGLVWAAVGFAAVSATELLLREQREQRSERALADSTRRIIDTTRDAGNSRDGSGDDPGGSLAATGGFTGRYRLGPESAPIRLVVISDYQCAECRQLDEEARAVLASRGDVSFSPKHFPVCQACNRHATSNPHPNACWAARAAETAGILRGAEGFLRMHEWLFARGGGFTDAELDSGLRALGYEPGEFTAIMQGPETLRRVQEDIEEAMSLGIHSTPMIFINGVELRGWTPGRGALLRAVQTLAQGGLEPATAAADSPPPASEKVIEDWRQQPALDLPPGGAHRRRGPQDAAVRIVIWGDYREPNCAKADTCVSTLLSQGAVPGGMSYTFRHFPLDRECNPAAPKTLHPQACLAARAAEAAGALGGGDAFRRMHEWLMDQAGELSEEGLRDAAAGTGLDPEAFVAALGDQGVTDAIAADADAARRLGLPSIPFVFVNEKLVPRWSRGGECILGRIAAEAAQR